MSEPRPSPPVVLTVAGSDSGGGAGIQADLKTFCAHGVYGASVLTAVTAQNTRGVTAVHGVPPAIVEAQLDAVFGDLEVAAVKIGMLGNAEVVRAVADGLRRHASPHVILDPVMVAQSGDVLLEESAVAALVEELLPLADVVTPNLPEASRLTGLDLDEALEDADEDSMAEAGRLLAERSGDERPTAVLVKGGHGSGEEVVDLLWHEGVVRRFVHPRIRTRSTHGTGCTLSSAIAARRALGDDLERAVGGAIDYLHGALAAAYPVGGGHGPVDHLYGLEPARPV